MDEAAPLSLSDVHGSEAEVSHPDQPRRWRRSTTSNYGNCVEVSFDDDLVHVRNSRDPRGPALVFTTPEWQAFLDGAHAHEFDCPAEPRK